MAYFSFFTLGAFGGASGLCLPLISLDRCIRMAKLTYYRQYVTKQRVFAILALTWVNASVITLMPFYGVPQSTFYACLIGYLVIISIIMLASYTYVVRKSRPKLNEVMPTNHLERYKYIDQTKEVFRQLKLTITVTRLIAVIIVSWLPAFIASLVWALGAPASDKNEAIVTARNVFLTLGFAASTVNPLLYCSKIRDVRKAALSICRKCLQLIWSEGSPWLSAMQPLLRRFWWEPTSSSS